MKRCLLLLVLLPVLLAGPALAVVPSTMSYQGVLTDDAGVLMPDGPYSLTFKLYTVASGGSAIWTETQSPVALSRGGFSVILGSVVPLSGLAFDVPYWLGIMVGGGTEMSPRVALASSPYGLSLRLPFAGGVLSTSPALAIANTGTGPAITADPLLTVGTPSSDGTVLVYANGAGGAEIVPWSGYGGALYLRDENGLATTLIEPDADGTGGWFYVGNAFIVDGNFGGTGSSGVFIYGTSDISFLTNLTGDAAVQLPDSSVSAYEMLDEPGIAQGHASNVLVPIGSTMVDIVTVTLTTPAAGYIVLEADATHILDGSATAAYNRAIIQIDETAGGGDDGGGRYFVSGYSGGTASLSTHVPICLHRTYYKTAGTYTFRLEARGEQNETLYNYLWSPTITATFYPTSYGSVTAAVTPEEASQFTDVHRTLSAGQAQPAGSGESLLVDLRELELRATKERLEAEQAQRQLIEAQLAQQQAKAAKSATRR